MSVEYYDQGTGNSNFDTLNHYLDQIGSFASLGAIEVNELAYAVQDGICATEKLKRETFESGAEFSELQNLRQLGEVAKKKLVQANLRLVVSVARRYRGKGMPFMDLVQEGNLGLLKAAQKFNPELGNEFSTFAVVKIRERIIRSFYDQGRRNTLSREDGEQVSKLSRIQRQLAEEFFRDPTVEELAMAMKKPTSTIIDLINIMYEPLYLDAKIYGDESDATLLDTIINTQDGVELSFSHESDVALQKIELMLSQLTRQREKIVRGLTGLMRAECQNLTLKLLKN